MSIYPRDINLRYLLSTHPKYTVGFLLMLTFDNAIQITAYKNPFAFSSKGIYPYSIAIGEGCTIYIIKILRWLGYRQKGSKKNMNSTNGGK